MNNIVHKVNGQQQNRQFIPKPFNGKCNYCKEKSHKRQDCKNRQNHSQQQPQHQQQPAHQQRQQNVNTANTENSHAQPSNVYAFTVAVEEQVLAAEDEDGLVWYGDSGAGKHFTFHRDWFETFQELVPDSINSVLGDLNKYPAVGIGTVCVLNSKRQQFVLTNTLYVSRIGRNMFSTGEVSIRSYKTIILDYTLKIYKELLLEGAYVGQGLYRMDLTTIKKVQINSSKSSGLTPEIWHRRLGHACYSSIN